LAFLSYIPRSFRFAIKTRRHNITDLLNIIQEDEALKRIRIMRVAGLFCAILMLFHFTCLADDTVKTTEAKTAETKMAAAKTAEDAYELGELVVTGEKGGVESVGSVQIVTAEDIRRKGTTNLNEEKEGRHASAYVADNRHKP
jgi:hypothetical protein